VTSYCNHGRWVAECGTTYCHEAHLVQPGDSFVCRNCGVDHGLVEFPADLPLIDAALSRRIVPETRNWIPGETVIDLEAENAQHVHEGVIV